MTNLHDSISKGNNLPPDSYFANYLIEETSEVIELRLKALGWDRKSLKASVIIYFKSKEVKYV